MTFKTLAKMDHWKNWKRKSIHPTSILEIRFDDQLIGWYFDILVWDNSSSLCDLESFKMGRWSIGGCFVFVGRRSKSECSRLCKMNFMISFQLMIFEIVGINSFTLVLWTTWDISDFDWPWCWSWYCWQSEK